MMTKRYIQPVSDNFDKQNTYREWIGRYNKAIQYEFYYEALLIDYAMMEDRLRSFMYYMGALYDRKSFKANKGKAIPFLKTIVAEYKRKDESGGLIVSCISGKRKILRSVLIWAAEVEGIDKNQRYLWTLKSQCESLDTAELLKQLSKMEEWCDYRNEIIHALMNKNVLSVNEELKERAIEGMEIARYFDAQLRIFKRGNKIRKSIQLPEN